MPKSGPKLVEDFLIPSLNRREFPDTLWWDDPDRKIFKIKWNHKSASEWTEKDTAVFQAWDLKKGRVPSEGDKSYHMLTKQRFRSALYKLDTIEELPIAEKTIKCYRIVCKPKIKKNKCSSESFQELPPVSPTTSESELYLNIASDNTLYENQSSPVPVYLTSVMNSGYANDTDIYFEQQYPAGFFPYYNISMSESLLNNQAIEKTSYNQEIGLESSFDFEESLECLQVSEKNDLQEYFSSEVDPTLGSNEMPLELTEYLASNLPGEYKLD